MRSVLRSFVLLALVLFMLPTSLAAGEDGCESCTGCGEWAEYTLYAGQDLPVGKVLVNNCEDKIGVQYVLDEGSDWLITEVHLSIGDEVADIPMTKKGSPVPGQFAVNECFDPGVTFTQVYCFDRDPGWDVGDALIIAAHAVVQKEDCVVNASAPYGPIESLDTSQGLRYDYTPVRTERSNADAVLTYNPSSSSEADFYSLGFQEDRAGYDPDVAFVVVRFDTPVLNRTGADLRIIEDTWGLPYPVELAEVWAKADAADPWTLLGYANNQNPVNSWHTISDFDLGSLASASYVKVKDVSVRADFASKYPAQGATLDGFDLNAVMSLQDNSTCTVYSETAWGDGAPFVEKGNWATYITYTIQDCVTCTPTTVDFTSVPLGGSIVGLGTVQELLQIATKSGSGVSLAEGSAPAAYGAPNDASSTWNGGMAATGGFVDMATKNAVQAHAYTFTFASGISVNAFSLHMLDFGDYNPTRSTTHYASMVAYDSADNVVDSMELSYTSDGLVNPRSSSEWGDLWYTGDAVEASAGQPGNWMWSVSGDDIVRIELQFGAGFDPNIAFDLCSFTACQ